MGPSPKSPFYKGGLDEPRVIYREYPPESIKLIFENHRFQTPLLEYIR